MLKFGLLLSGGMDSAVLLWDIATRQSRPSKFFLFQFNYGSAHAKKELEASSRIAALAKKVFPQHEFFVHRIDLPFSEWGIRSGLLEAEKDIPDGHYEEESMKKTVVPFRNGIMLSIACGILKEGTLFYGGHAGDHTIYPDCRKSFAESMERAIKEGTDGDVFLLAPFINKSKREIALLGRALNVPFTETWSCYKGGDTHCGTCGTCVERKEALEGFDATEYQS